MPFAMGDPQYQARVGAFLEGLQKLGHIDGSNVRIDYRASAGNSDEIRFSFEESLLFTFGIPS
jgi:hypothetical protein